MLSHNRTGVGTLIFFNRMIRVNCNVEVSALVGRVPLTKWLILYVINYSLVLRVL